MQWGGPRPPRKPAQDSWRRERDTTGVLLPDEDCVALSEFAGRVGLAITGFFAACGVAGSTGVVLAWLGRR